MMVSPASRMLRAISFGVFWRTAPSTSEIMRSRKVEPCAAVMRTLIQSESTLVPPVTAERSPPLSRMTGADSPVMADSSTEAMPSMTSPSLGMKSPASTRTMSPALSSSAETLVKFRAESLLRRFAIVCVRMRRRLSACALPRPSATASAKFAKITVNQSQNAICAENSTLAPTTTSRMTRIVVNTDTISTTNMTGLRIKVRGSSLRKESMMARVNKSVDMPATVFCRPSRRSRGVDARSAGCDTEPATAADLACDWSFMDLPSVQRSGKHLHVLDHRAERERREIDQSAGDDDDADQQRDVQPVVCRECSGG